MGSADEARAAALLASAGVATSGLVELTGSWSNEVWMTDTHVLRVASRRGPDSLAHELAVAASLPATVRYPHPVATGRHDDLLWSVAPRVPGRPLHQAWVEADPGTRAELIARLAESLRALHAVVLPAEVAAPAPARDGRPPGGGPPVEATAMPAFVRSFVADAVATAAIPSATADAVLDVLERVQSAVHPEPVATVHADLSFDNAIWDGRQVWLIDLEWCCSAPVDYELVNILRCCFRPEATVAPEWRDRVAATDHAEVPVLLRRAYPELFAPPRLRDRLMVYGLAGFARGWHWRPDLWRAPVDQPHHPSIGLLDFVTGGGWLSLLA